MTDNNSWGTVPELGDLNLQLNKTLVMEFADIDNRKDAIYCVAELDANMGWEDKRILELLTGVEVVSTLSAICLHSSLPTYAPPVKLMSSFLIIDQNMFGEPLTTRNIFTALEEKFDRVVEFKRIHWFFNKVDVEAYIDSFNFEFTSGKVDEPLVEISAFVIRDMVVWGQQTEQAYQGAPMGPGFAQNVYGGSPSNQQMQGPNYNRPQYQHPYDINSPYSRD